MIVYMQPPQRRGVPSNQLRIRWNGIVAGDLTGANVSGPDGLRYTFDGYQQVAGLRRSPSDDWYLDLDRIDGDLVDLWVHPAGSTRCAALLFDLNSEAGVEHAGLDVTAGQTAMLFRLERAAHGWTVAALLGDLDRDRLFDGGEIIVVSVDRSASMHRWYADGTVSRLLGAIQTEARDAGVTAIRVSFPGGESVTAPQIVATTAEIADLVNDQLGATGMATGADVVLAATGALARAGDGDRVAVLVTDAPPTGSLQELADGARAVIALLGERSLAGSFDAGRWERIGQAGVGVVPLGSGDQSHDVLVGLLSDGLQN